LDTPERFFYPVLQARRSSDAPLTRALSERLRRSCEELTTPGTAAHIDHEERQSEWWTSRQGGRRLPAAIETLAAGGILLEDRYTDCARAIFQTIVDHRIVENTGGTNYGRPYHTWRDNPLDAGASSIGLALGLDLLGPSLSAEEVAQFGSYVVPFVDYLLADPPDPEGKKPDWNIACIGLTGLGLLALVLRSQGVLDAGRFSRALDLSRRRALLFLEKGHDGDGAFYEGPGYGNATLARILRLVYALAVCGDRELVSHDAWVRIAEGHTHELIPGTGRPNLLNDCNDQFDISWMPLIAAEHRNGLVQWTWQKINGVLDRPPEDPIDPAWAGDAIHYLMFHDPGLEPVPPGESGLPQKMHFRNRGLVDIRSGWEPDDFFLSFLCDVFPAGGHRQADRNQFSLHALGESFAIDSGYSLEALPDTTEVLRLGATGEAHNLPLVHGEMQRRGRVSADGIRRLSLDIPTPYIESDAGESYPSATRFTRRCLCLPSAQGDPACLVVADLLTFDIQERPLLSWLLHTHEDNGVELSRDRLTLTGGRKGNRCEVQMVTPWPGRWRQETFAGHPRLRYDWFWSPLLCLVAFVPYRRGTAPPVIESEGTPDGCALSCCVDDSTYTVLAAAPGRTATYNRCETDAELALVCSRGKDVQSSLLAGGSQLSVAERRLVDRRSPAAFAT